VNKAKIWRGIVGVGVLVIIGLVVVTVINGQYLEAIAISSVGSVFAWFALGADRKNE
jgi:hypothetical protein